MSTNRGTALLKAIEYYTKHAKTWDTLHIFPKVPITKAGNGYMSGDFTVTENICNASDTLHGGFISSVIDVFSCYAAFQHPKGQPSWTTEMNIMYLSMAKIGDTINVETKPVKISKNRFVMECFLTNKTSGSLIAKGSISFVPAIGLDLSKNLPFDNNTQN